jgi:periplasmic copper chaperone A
VRSRRLTTTLLCVAIALVGCRDGRQTGDSSALATVEQLSILDAFAPEPVTGAVGALYFAIRNDGQTDDELVSVSTDVSDEATFHDQVGGSGMQAMQEMAAVAVPAGGATIFEPGGMHVMLNNLKRAYRRGDSIRVSLTFARGGTVEFAVPVVSYDEVAARMDTAHESHHP